MIAKVITDKGDEVLLSASMADLGQAMDRHLGRICSPETPEE